MTATVNTSSRRTAWRSCTLGPWEADDGLRTLPGALDSGLTAPISSVKDMGSNGMMLAPWPDVAQAHGFISGFTSTRISPPQDGQSRGLQNVVLRFPDAAAAAAAAAEMAAKAPPLRDIAPSPPAPVANTPESLAVTYALPDGITRVDSFTPHGSFVLYQSARTATAFIGKSARTSSSTPRWSCRRSESTNSPPPIRPPWPTCPSIRPDAYWH